MEKEKNDIILSIIIPMYKVEQYLGRCFQCLDRQIHDNIEIVFVDDGSPDNSGEMCEKYAKGKDYVTVIHKENGGLSDARNVGINYASGKYCMFLDSDDTIEEHACKKIMDYLKKYGVDILYLDINWISKKKIIQYGKRGFEKEKILSGKEALAKELYCEKYAAMAPLGIYRREFLRENSLYFKKGILHEDEQWSPKVMYHAKKVVRIEYAFYNYYIHEGSITQNKNLKRYRDLIGTVYDLSGFYEGIHDERINIYGGRYIAKLYMNAFANLHVSGESIKLDKFFLIKKMSGKKNRCKLVLFLCSPKLYLRMIGQ